MVAKVAAEQIYLLIFLFVFCVAYVCVNASSALHLPRLESGNYNSAALTYICMSKLVYM